MLSWWAVQGSNFWPPPSTAASHFNSSSGSEHCNNMLAHRGWLIGMKLKLMAGCLLKIFSGSISNIDDIDPNKCADIAKGKKNKVISGVVGAASSVTSIQVANLLRLFKIPQVSITHLQLTFVNPYESFFVRTYVAYKICASKGTRGPRKWHAY